MPDPRDTAKCAACQIVHSITLALELNTKGVACAVVFPLTDVPFVRVEGLETLEAVAVPGGYEIWSTNTDPPDPVPLRLAQSLAETVLFLSSPGGRA